jgi:hypothetical protein
MSSKDASSTTRVVMARDSLELNRGCCLTKPLHCRYNESFSYSSLCPLSLNKQYLDALPESRVLGSMEGSFLMLTGAVGQKGHQAIIDPFYFILPPDVQLPS